MKHLKTFCMMMVIALFALQTTASVAVAACNCPEMQDQTTQVDNASSDMPCHGMDQAEADADSSNNDHQMANCDKCGCGHCKVTSSAALTNKLSPDQITSFNAVATIGNDSMKSLFPYGIDYPPKPIS